MSNPEAFVAALLYSLWLWRVGSFLYTSYSVSESVTPGCAGAGGKLAVAALLSAGWLLLHLLPLDDFPRLSLANRILSIPSQVNSIRFVNKFVANAIDSRRVTVFLSVISAISVLETMYMILNDWDRIE